MNGKATDLIEEQVGARDLVANTATGQVFMQQGPILWTLQGSACYPQPEAHYQKVGEAPSLHDWQQDPEAHGPVWLAEPADRRVMSWPSS